MPSSTRVGLAGVRGVLEPRGELIRALETLLWEHRASRPRRGTEAEAREVEGSGLEKRHAMPYPGRLGPEKGVWVHCHLGTRDLGRLMELLRPFCGATVGTG